MRAHASLPTTPSANEPQCAHGAAAAPSGAADPACERAAALAAQLSAAPVGLVNLIGADTQHLAGASGGDFPLRVLPRCGGYCETVAASGRPLRVEDAARQSCFAALPVVREQGLRAYCGVPLFTRDGRVVGALSVLDRVPRAWSQEQVAGLQCLAAQLAEQFDARAEIAALHDSLRQALPDGAVPAGFPEELARANSMLDVLLGNAATGVALFDAAGRCLRMNPAFESIAGAPPAACLGRTPQEFSASAGPGLKHLLERVMTAGTPVLNLEFTTRDAAGPRHWLVHAHPIGSAAARPDGVGLFFTDITQQKLTERALRLSEQNLRLATEAASLGLWYWDIEQSDLVWNDQCLAMFGLAPGTGVTYERFLALLHPDDRAATAAAVDQSLAECADYRARYRVNLANGELRWIEARGRAFANALGKPHYMMGVVMDVTDMKCAADRLQRQSEELQRMNETLASMVDARTQELQRLSQHLVSVVELEKAQLARELHDELGAHLTAIQMEIGAALRHLGPADAQLVRHLEAARDMTRKTTAIKRRIIEGLRPSMIESLGLAEALQFYLSEFAGTSGLAVDVQIAPEVDVFDEQIAIALYRIAQESLTNIVKYAAAARVVVKLESDAAGLRLEIADDGCGMPPDHARRAGAHGIAGMRVRAAQLGGQFDIGPNPAGCGTRVSVLIPHAAPPRA